ncbi:crosslink repair DNA glycosylase YcaQ family protein [Bradyrhizobium sp. UFLA05-109]
MPRTPKPLPLQTSQARQIWLHAQRLDTREPFGVGAQAVADAIAHLGYVQIDTINVIERCHHHILYSRIPSYRRADLRHAQSVDRSVFEYWTHALSYVPTSDFRFFLPAMREHRRDGHKWYASVTPADMRKVMRLVRAGPLTIRDIEDDVLTEKEHLWQSRKPSKRALQLAFYTGVVTISERQGMLKTYELMTRHFGWDKLPKPASAKDSMNYLLDRALRSQGLVSLDSICHLDAPSKRAVARLIASRVRRGDLVPLALEGAGKQEHWAAPSALEPGKGAPPDLVHILSPFDPLIIQRKRTNLIFGYNHLFEAYVPKAKRKLGYFALPVLVGDEIVAALDLKADRQNKKVLMQKWTWVGNGKKTAGRKELKHRIEDELDRFACFQLAEQDAGS